jgi:hypothetical protein
MFVSDMARKKRAASLESDTLPLLNSSQVKEDPYQQAYIRSVV